MPELDRFDSLSPRFYVFWIGLCTVLVMGVFWLGLKGGFILDDWPNIVQNTSVHLSQITVENLLYASYSFEPGGSSRPLSMLSFALDFWRAGLNPEAFKVTNVVIHGLTCFFLALFFRLVLRLTGWSPHQAYAAALLMALVWAIHPLQVSSVLYVVQRMQTLGTLFLLLALLAYLHMRRAQLSGERSRLYGVLTLLFWVLAFACKEDSAMLPAYTLLAELTLLRFHAASPRLSKQLCWTYGVFAIVGVLAFLFVVVPHYWHWQAYPGRDFSSPERLLTQGRVLVMYIGQILLPLPESMKFFYDDIAISRSLWYPLSTLPALVLLIVLLAWAWSWRSRRPVFSLGVLLFFAGHFMTSNVINLELAFEHRNHFPLIGVVLAIGDLLVAGIQRFRLRSSFVVAVMAAVLVALGALTLMRVYAWGDNLRLAQDSVKFAPHSERAWAFLGATYFELSKQQADSPYLELAIKNCREGSERIPQSAILANNVVIYKTVQGSVTQQDWDVYLQRLRGAPMTVQNKGILWVTLNNAERRKYKNEQGVLETIEIITSRTTLRPSEYLRVAAYVFNETHEPIRAFAYMQRAVELSSPDDPAIQKMLRELVQAGRQDWVDRLIQIQRLTGVQDNNS